MIKSNFTECNECDGKRCIHIGLKCDQFPVLNPKLQPLLDWRHMMCNKVTRVNRACILNNATINIRGDWDVGCGKCPYGG